MASMLESETGGQNQSASSSPGWNDPPPATAITRSAGTNRLHLQRQRRPVDPSVLGNANFVQFGSNNSNNNDANLQPPALNPQFHQSRSFPQLHSDSYQPQMLPSAADRPFLGVGTHPNSAFTPVNAASLAIAHSQSQNSLQNAPGFTQMAANPQMSAHYTGHPASIPVPPPSMGTNLPLLSEPPAHYQPNMIHNEHTNQMQLSQQGHHSNQLQNQHHRHSFDSSHQQPQIQMQQMAQNPSCPSPIDGQPQLFSPPNIVPIMGNGNFTAMAGTENDQYKIPVKAAGDVSLNGQQLVSFLTKAIHLLQQGPTREGIQLRINQFGELVRTRQISEPCLKKLNFVVDGIDRHAYEEAWQFFDQMQANFPQDCAIGGWAHGVRLLIQELRKAHLPSRAHSAGTRLVS